MPAKTIRRLLVVALILLLVGTAFWWAGRPKPVAVALKEIDRGKVESTIANTRAGTVEACLRTKLNTIAGGRIETMAVKEGDRVKKGQLLMRLWNDDQKAQYTLAQTGLDATRKHVAEACVPAANAEREADRQAALHAKGFVSSSAEELARADAQAKHATCEAAKADVTEAQAKVEAAKVDLARTVLYAPFDGIVAKIVGEVGEFSTPSPPGVPTPPAIDLIDDSCMYVSAPMDEVDAPKVKAGQTVRITLDAFPKQPFAGTVRRVAPFVSEAEKQARTVDVEANFDHPEAAGRLLVGYSADIEVILATRENVVRVPTSALQEGSKVLVAGNDGVLQERKIKTGVANWEYTEVPEGLNAGEKVVTSLEREGVKAGVHYVSDNGK